MATGDATNLLEDQIPGVGYQDWEGQVPDAVADLPNGDGTALAGEVIKVGDWYGIVNFDCSDGDTVSLKVDQIARLPKATGVLAWGDKFHFTANPTGTKNNYWVTKATTSTTPIHGYVLEDAASGDETVLVEFRRPPHQLIP